MGTDQPEHFGHRRLQLQCLFQVVEEPRVADGDRGLVGERLQDRRLLLVEGSDLGAAEVDLADPLAVDL